MGRYNDLYVETRKKIAQANALVQQLNDDGYGKLTVINLGIKTAKKVTGGAGNKFIRGSAKNIKDMERLNDALDKFLNSPWVSEEGREEIRKRTISTFEAGAGKSGIKLSKAEATLAIDFFANDAVAKAREIGGLSSDDVIALSKMAGDVAHIDIIVEQALIDAEQKGIKSDKYFQHIRDYIKKK